MLDTERLRFKALRQSSAELFGSPISYDILQSSLGLSSSKAEELAKNTYGNNYPYIDIRRRADEIELATIRSHGVPVKNGLYDVLERLKKNGIPLAVATSSRTEIVKEYLTRSNVLKYFDVIMCGNDVRYGKPHPEIFLTAADRLNCKPENCLMFEDSENGLRSASGAGGITIHIRDIKEPRQEIKQKIYLSYGGLNEFLEDLIDATQKFAVPNLVDDFPKTPNGLKVGIHGFGAMGGGYLAQLFSHWDGYTRPTEIIAATGNMALIELVNSSKSYQIEYFNPAFCQTIERIRLISLADESAICQMYIESEVIGLSIPENAVEQQSRLIALGLLARHRTRKKSLTLITIINKVSGASFVKRCVKHALERLTNSLIAEIILRHAHFVETVANRIVTKLYDVKLPYHDNNSADLPSEHYAPLLFNSSPEMALYVQRGSPYVRKLRQVEVVDDLKDVQLVKSSIINGTHAIIAWYSSLLGYLTIGHGMRDKRVATLFTRIMERELKPAISIKTSVTSDLLDRFTNDFTLSCQSSFRDPCTRVGRHPLRKLQRNERILGSIELAHKHKIQTPMLEFGAALGLLYAIRSIDPKDDECKLIRSIYYGNMSVLPILTYFSGSEDNRCLDFFSNGALIDRISDHFNRLNKPASDHLNWPTETGSDSFPQRFSLERESRANAVIWS